MQNAAWLTGAAGQLVGQIVQLAWILPPLVALELLWPRGMPGQRLKGLALLTVYFVLTASILATTALLLQWLGVRPLFVVRLPASAPAWERFAVSVGTTLFAAVLSDFLYYWCHRAQHHFPVLWRFHAVHHAIRDLNVVNAYPHWTEELVRLPFMTAPLALLVPVGGGWVPWITGLVILQSYYLHSATRLNFGPLRYVLNDNRSHRIHHSIEARHYDKNFGVMTPLWDVLFGTACFDDEWPETGVVGFAEVDGILDYVVRPFNTSS